MIIAMKSQKEGMSLLIELFMQIKLIIGRKIIN